MERRCRYRHGTLLCVHAGERGARTRSAGGSEGGEWASAAWSPMGVPPIVAPRQLVTLAPTRADISARRAPTKISHEKSKSLARFLLPNSRVTRASRSHDVGAAGCRARFSASRRVPPSTRRRTRAAMHVILPSPHGPSTPEPPIIPPMKTKKPPRKTKRRPGFHLTTLPNFNKNDRSSRCRRCPRR